MTYETDHHDLLEPIVPDYSVKEADRLSILPSRGFAVSSRSRQGRRTKEEIQRDYQEVVDRTNREIDELYSEHARRLSREQAKSIGAAYARYSTKFQDSVVDQIRTILEEAEKLGIHVPREFIFFDTAVRGAKLLRPGLEELRAILHAKRVQALLLFSTSRLFRKTYRTLAFVDAVHKGLRIRCVFVKSGVDTDDKQGWEQLLAAQSLVDQFVVTVHVSNIRSAHEGLLERRIVFGTLTYGYDGEPIPGQVTKRNLPKRRIIIDPTTSKVVAQIFRWYVNDRLTINEIIRRLNAQPNTPLPPKCSTDSWTRLAVRTILRNTRYRGEWRYGVFEAVFLPEEDYVRQYKRDIPLKSMQVEALRIIPDKLWYAAQIRLSNERNRGGRPPKDGERKSRPKLLNGLFVCPTHDHNLYVGGPNGRSMFCSHCQRLPAEERPLFTLLNRRLALDRTCAVLADLVRDDHDLVDAVIAACRQEAEALQRQDPEELQRLHRELEKLTKAIDFTSRNPGDSESDQVESAKRLRDLRRQREGLAAKIAELEAAGADLIRIPTEEEVRTLIRNLNLTLVLAANGGTDEEMAITRQIIETMIDGKIQLVQMGQRKAQRGWLQGRAHVRLVSFLASRAGGRLPRGMDETREVRIDYKWPRKFDQDVERAWQLYKQDKLCREIADVLGCSRSYVTKLLKAGAAQNGEQLLDGRTRRGKLEAKNVIFPRYIQIADAVRELDGQKLLLGEIANRLGVNIAIVKKALAFLSSSDGVAALDGRTRRKGLDQKTRKSKDDQPSKGEQGMRVA